MNRIITALVILFLTSCREENQVQVNKHENIFGSWKVTHAEFIMGNNALYNLKIDDKGLEKNYLNYKYLFSNDSTFAREKHGNDEAKGKFFISNDEKIMYWNLDFDDSPAFDSIPVEIIAISPIKMILNEAMGGQHKMLHVLERESEK